MRFKPNDLQIPKKYFYSCSAISWFTAGYNDQINGRKGPDEVDLRSDPARGLGAPGDDLWEAYSEGRRAAREAFEDPSDTTAG